MGASTVSSSMYTAQAAYPKRVGNLSESGRERVIVASYTTTAIESGSTINFMTIPQGAILTGVTVHSEDNGTAPTLTMYYGSTAISAALDIHSGAAVNECNIAAFVGAASEAATLIKGVTGGATLTASTDIVVVARYVLD